jgi:hypothetical protein
MGTDPNSTDFLPPGGKINICYLGLHLGEIIIIIIWGFYLGRNNYMPSGG